MCANATQRGQVIMTCPLCVFRSETKSRAGIASCPGNTMHVRYSSELSQPRARKTAYSATETMIISTSARG